MYYLLNSKIIKENLAMVLTRRETSKVSKKILLLISHTLKSIYSLLLLLLLLFLTFMPPLIPRQVGLGLKKSLFIFVCL